mgnify:CR=1 FL=1
MAKFYRNKKEVCANGVTVDECSLWELKQGKMVLVDEDQFIAVIPSANFEEAL